MVRKRKVSNQQQSAEPSVKKQTQHSGPVGQKMKKFNRRPDSVGFRARKFNRRPGSVEEQLALVQKLKQMQIPPGAADYIDMLGCFIGSDDLELTFPGLTSDQRKFIHFTCNRLYLKSQSSGCEPNRVLHIRRRPFDGMPKNGDAEQQNPNQLSCSLHPFWNILNQQSYHFPRHMAEQFLSDDVNELVKKFQEETANKPPKKKSSKQAKKTFKTIEDFGGPPPRCPAKVKFITARTTLPIFSYREKIMNEINSNKLVLLVGETGSGKSTQIPQYIVEDAVNQGRPCHVLVAQPRRIAAVSLAERVASERQESVGKSVGYRVRLDKRTSQDTVITFCTHGILLNNLTGGTNGLKSFTHLIIDEIHERDRISDFLLIMLRDRMSMFPHLRIMLMSASLDVNLFRNYFNECAVVEFPGRSYPVEVHHLEDVLQMTNYVQRLAQMPRNNGLAPTVGNGYDAENFSEPIPEIDEALEAIWRNNDHEQLASLVQKVQNKNLDVNYRHSANGSTLLMLAAGLSANDAVNQLLKAGANAMIKSNSGMKARNWAESFGNMQTATQLAKLETSTGDLGLYLSMTKEGVVDYGLIVAMLKVIMSQDNSGAILIFLPGYDDIISTKRNILDSNLAQISRLKIIELHSQMSNEGQKEAFQPCPPGVRKVVLSTNIAEISITLEDVVYVIDCGRVKQKVYNADNGISTLTPVWISKANAEQRMGRAGRCRPGFCYRLFSECHFRSMPDSPVPELTRTSLLDLCLQIKVIDPSISIAEFLSKAPTPPDSARVTSSIKFLVETDALTDEETLTPLGKILSQLPVDVELGKALVYAVLLQCLDPVIDIVSTLSHRDPFYLPREPSQIQEMRDRRFELGQTTPFSDHGLHITVFNGWKRAQMERNVGEYLERNFLVGAGFRVIDGIRGLIWQALRFQGICHDLTDREFREVGNKNSHRWPLVLAALTAGLYPKIAHADRETGFLKTRMGRTLIHASSILRGNGSAGGAKTFGIKDAVRCLPSNWVIYNEISSSGGGDMTQIRSASSIPEFNVPLFARLASNAESAFLHTRNLYQKNPDEIVKTSNRNKKCDDGVVEFDDWLTVKMPVKAAANMLALRAIIRRRLASLLETRRIQPDPLLDSVMDIICQSDPDLDYDWQTELQNDKSE